MKRLIVVRHSEYNGVALTPGGKEMFDKLLDKLRPEWEGASVSIISAPADRAQQSAQIIATKTKATVTVVKDLDGEGFRSPSKEQWQQITKQLIEQTSDVVFAVMHREETEIMPQKIAEALFAPTGIQEVRSNCYKLGHNDSYVLDFEQKNVRTVWIAHK